MERRFWMEGEAFFAEALAAEATLLFADPVGRLDRAAAVGVIGGAPRWSEVGFSHQQCRPIADGIALISYDAVASREGQHSTYRTWAATVYVREDDGWKLTFHQQTPHPAGN